jgi:hypothetical protein
LPFRSASHEVNLKNENTLHGAFTKIRRDVSGVWTGFTTHPANGPQNSDNFAAANV